MDYFFVYSNHDFNNYFGYYYKNDVIIKDDLTRKYIDDHIENKFNKVIYVGTIIEYYYNIDKCKLFIDNYNNLMLSNLHDYTFMIFDLSEKVIKVYSDTKDSQVLNKFLDKNIKTLDDLFC